MQESKGKISRIWQNETQNGKKYWVVSVQTDAGSYTRLSVWDWKLLEGVQERDVISYKFETKGQYSNLVEISKTEKLGIDHDDLLEYHKGNRAEVLAKMSAIKSASTLLSNYSGEPQEKLTKTLEAAQAFIDYMFSPVTTSGKPEPSSDNGDGKRRKKNKKETSSEQVPPTSDKDMPF